MTTKTIGTAVASSATLILFTAIAFAAPPYKFESLSTYYYDDSEIISVWAEQDSSGYRNAFVNRYDLISGAYSYCYGALGRDALQVIESAKKGSVVFNTADLTCIDDSIADVSADCETDRTSEYNSVGTQTIKTLNGTTTYHGTYKETQATCTITINGQSWTSFGGTVNTRRSQ